MASPIDYKDSKPTDSQKKKKKKKKKKERKRKEITKGPKSSNALVPHFQSNAA